MEINQEINQEILLEDYAKEIKLFDNVEIIRKQSSKIPRKLVSNNKVTFDTNRFIG